MQVNHSHWEALPKFTVLSFPWPLPESYLGLHMEVSWSRFKFLTVGFTALIVTKVCNSAKGEKKKTSPS